MPITALSPGVYRSLARQAPPASLATGVPGFVGFAGAGAAGQARLTAFADFRASLTGVAADSPLERAVRGFFDNGGTLCHVAAAAPAATDRAGALLDAFTAIEPISDIDLVACPEASLLQTAGGEADPDAMVRVQRGMLAHAAAHRRFALLDAAPGSSTAMVLKQRAAVVLGIGEPIDGALYYPWLKDESGAAAPPCGHVAGVIASTDAAFGVARAPAGGEIQGVLDVEVGLDAVTQADLNAAGVNGLRAFPGRGVRVWGARTLSADPDWTYINVRRLFLTLGRWIDANLGWTVFEPNAPSTWARVERVLTGYLTGLWRSNALLGATADQAFFVHCDASTNPASARDLGGLVVELGLAAASPAEFVTVRLDLLAQAA